MIRQLILVFFFIPVLSFQAFAENLAKAQSALESGDFLRAKEILTSLSEKDNEKAQFLLGSMYYQGFGVARDIEKAFFWVNLAARKNSEFSALVQKISKELPPPVIAKLRQSCRKWLQSKSLLNEEDFEEEKSCEKTD
ncbi:MAG: hypothetical protein AB1403_19560 [Candidatus Riflebacteria bacterium]